MPIAKLVNLQSLDDVAVACGTDLQLLKTYAEAAEQHPLYRVIKIQKRGNHRGRFRVVYAATKDWLSQFHRQVAMIIANSYNFGAHVQGFVKKRSIVTNASQHLGAARLLHADIDGFFDAICEQQVKVAFASLGCSAVVAEFLARCCTIDGLLRQGTRCGPAIANLVCRGLDADLLRLASARGAVYTRYADDMTFSGDSVPEPNSIKLVVEGYGFKLRGGRCTSQRRGRRQYVTGLSVADKTAPRLPKRIKRQLRQILHYLDKYGYDKIAGARLASGRDNQLFLYGYVRYAFSVEPERAARWAEIYDSAIAGPPPEIKIPPQLDRPKPKV